MAHQPAWRAETDGTFDESDELDRLRRRVQALEAARRRTDEFLATLAHELRNPLAPIKNAVSLMQMGGLSASMTEWYGTVIDRQITLLTRLVDDLLDVSRIGNGKIALRREPVDLAVVVESAVDAARPLVQARRHDLAIVLPDEPLRVLGDPTRLVQIVLNLLTNAAKYTPEGGEILLSAAREGEEVAAIRVSDTGLGIAADLLPRIFDLFTQGDRSIERAEGGLGIGLALVRGLVEQHGGTVEARSDGAGRGSELTVRLPLLAAAWEATESGAAERLPDQLADQLADGLAEIGPRRVLVIDDDRDAAESLTVLLELWGHEVRLAYGGTEGVGLAATYRPDAVLLDIGLPGLSGYEVARRLRALPGGERAMLVAVTGYGQDEDRRRSRESGFDHHLTKPVEPAMLQGLLAAAPAR